MMRKTWMTIIILAALILTMGLFQCDNKKEGLSPDETLICRDPDTNLKIQDSDITKDAKNLIINQGTQVRKLYTENGMDLITPKVADHILVDVMGVRQRPIYEKYPACAKQLAKSLNHEMPRTST